MGQNKLELRTFWTIRFAKNAHLFLNPVYSFSESENTSTGDSGVSYITDESGGRIAVVPLGREVDASKVYVNPVQDDDKNVVNGVDNGNDDNNNDDDDDDNSDDDDDDDEDDNDDDDDEDYGGEEDGVSKETDESFDEQDYENDDSDDVIESDDDFIPENQSKSTRNAVKRKRNSGEGVGKTKKKNSKQQPSIQELPVADSENDTSKLTARIM